MKLEVGMYVRAKRKGIVKIDEVIENGVITYEDDFGREWEEETGRKAIRYISNDGWNCGLDEKDILKASHNIIDLIEVGDYVNGYPVYEIIEYEDNTRAIVIGDDNKSIIWEESSQYIKSIVTKEQFESMQYRIGD